jgi:hypothetical protein
MRGARTSGDVAENVVGAVLERIVGKNPVSWIFPAASTSTAKAGAVNRPGFGVQRPAPRSRTATVRDDRIVPKELQRI